MFWIDLEFYLIRAAPGVLLALLAVHALVRPAWRAWRWICASAAMLSILATVAAFVVAQDFTDRPQKYEVVMDFVVTFGVGALVASLGTVLVWTAGRPASDQAGTTQVEPV